MYNGKGTKGTKGDNTKESQLIMESARMSYTKNNENANTVCNTLSRLDANAIQIQIQIKIIIESKYKRPYHDSIQQ